MLPTSPTQQCLPRAATLDRLSGGRIQLAVGLGAVHEGWTAFEPDQGRATRVELLDEAGATWWLEGAWDLSRTEANRVEVQRRITAGPPDSPR